MFSENHYNYFQMNVVITKTLLTLTVASIATVLTIPALPVNSKEDGQQTASTDRVDNR